jgi:pimeloyl-ACP methyl ester carboxylesterase
MPTIHIDSTELEFIERGQGDPVVLVHGTLGDYRSWELQMDAFARTHRVISYSRRYHYPNHCDGSETDYSAALHGDDLAAFLDGIGLDSAHIVGNSYGAYTALFLALRQPEKVKTLTLAEPPIFPLLDESPEGGPLRDAFLREVWEPAGAVLQRGEAEHGVRVFVDGVVADGAFDQFSPEVQGLLLDNSCEFKAETTSDDFWTHVSREDVRKVQAPTLLLSGENTRRMFRLIVDELDRWMPNSDYVIVPESTHEIPADAPDEYNKIVLGFLADHAT